ncbi:MAG: hypothetical protein C4297_12045 [Gemmataceae bacterium]
MNLFETSMRLLETLVRDYPAVATLLAFVLGTIVGSYLNVCIVRLPLQKSILWPGSRCAVCLQKIRWYDNVPLVSYWVLRGRCRQCRQSFSMRYFWIELLTGVLFAGLFVWIVVWNSRALGAEQPFEPARGISAGALVLVWLHAVTLTSLLLVATFTDLDYRVIPLGLTVAGTLLGILWGTLLPWPWPWPAEALFPAGVMTQMRFGGAGVPDRDILLLPAGLWRWPVWMPTPDTMPPGDWRLGLATGLAGALAGALGMRLVRSAFTWGLGKEALGLGDADLMMMIGAFLGWQMLVFTLVFAVLMGVIYAVFLIVITQASELAFGPFLAGGALITLVFCYDLGAAFQKLFFDGPLLTALALLVLALGLFVCLSLRMVRLMVAAPQ